MEELSWFNHHQQEIEESLNFGSDNIFLNPIQDLPKPDYVASSFGSASQYWRQTIAINSLHEEKNIIPLTTTTTVKNPRSVTTNNNPSQYYHQTTPVNILHEDKNVIPLTTTVSIKSPESVTTDSDTYTYTSRDYEDDISIIFSNYQNLSTNITKNPGDVTKPPDDVISSQCSSDKKPNNSSMFFNNVPRFKKPRSDPVQSTSSGINFRQTTEYNEYSGETMKEMIYRTAAFRPVSFSVEEVVEKPRRKNVRISSDPQTAAARRRREKISDRIRVLQKLVPGGSKMDTASMLDEAANYLKFLRSQVKAFEQVGYGTSGNAYSVSENVVNNNNNNVVLGLPFPMHSNPFLLPYYQRVYDTVRPS
ncbi:uncharacterized protein LOC143563704 [Bidens hawaiensis]|uniref:uncharacterized protein LOC143563704 n=1 Tax=Bidens hawaiensis TaxID=980011 RepID=UPI00404B7D33